MYQIHFGTSGWRDIIADGFTMEGVAAVTRAIAQQLKAKRLAAKGVLVGHDPRFLSENFAALAAEIMSREGIPVHLVKTPTPTPVLAAAILDLKLAGGINFTASHNPAQYQGLKWSNQHGGPATKEELAPIEAQANRLLAAGDARSKFGSGKAAIKPYDPKPAYMKRLAKMVPMEALRGSHLSVIADPLFGAGRGYLAEALQMAGCRVEVMHDWRDAFFGGEPPEPNAENLKSAAKLMLQKRAVLTLGTDGDADRFGVVDRDGTYLTPNQVLALTLYLLVKHRGWRGRVVRSVVTSHLVDAVAGLFDLPVEVTPVGFKYIGESMVRGGFLLGGEESGGLTIAGHVPEKDGVLACLLMAELVAREKKSLLTILNNIMQKTGTLISDRINVHLESQASGPAIQKHLNKNAPTHLAGRRVAKVDRMDGYKYILDNGDWLAIRLSGTEPVARIYLEAHQPAGLKRLAIEGKKLLAQG